MKVFASWSGGKDGCFALYRAKQSGHDVRWLINMTDERGEWSFTHRLAPSVLEAQAEALGIPLVQKRSTGTAYENEFAAVIGDLKKQGIEGGVFGDMDIEHHREWEENLCRRAGVEALLPLWHLPQEKVMEEFLSLGFEAVVVVTKEELLGSEYLGRKVDRAFLDEVTAKGITPCGEFGEFHTIVTDGPLFGRRIEITESEVRTNNGYCFLEIRACELRDK